MGKSAQRKLYITFKFYVEPCAALVIIPPHPSANQVKFMCIGILNSVKHRGFLGLCMYWAFVLSKPLFVSDGDYPLYHPTLRLNTATLWAGKV
jgi:hypothetical protein